MRAELVIGVGMVCLGVHQASAQSSAQAPAQTPAPIQAPAAAPARSDTPDSNTVADVVVTADRQKQSVNTVAGSVTALTGDSLNQIGSHSLQDVQALVPGLQFTGSGQGAGTITLRGINTGGEPSPLVAVMVDGVQIGSSSSFALGGATQVDVDQWDINRIEVARGPQGTLYGANSLGGLLQYIYNDPNLSRFEVRGETTGSGTQQGGGNYGVRVAVSAPIVRDEVGVRFSYSRQENAGFLDNQTTGQRGVNSLRQQSARLSFLARPNDRLEIRLNGVYQNVYRGSSDGVLYNRTTGSPLFGPLVQNEPRSDSAQQDFKQLSGSVSYDMGFATISALSSFSENRTTSNTDLSDSQTGFGLQALLPVRSSGIRVSPDVDKYVGELRIASPTNQFISWQGGFYHTEENTDQFQLIQGFLPSGQPLPGPLNPLSSLRITSQFVESAVYGDVTINITPEVDLQGGVRFTHNDQTLREVNAGFLVLPGTFQSKSSEDRAIYLGTLRYKFTPTELVYVRIASGYRPGGPNVAIAGAPSKFSSDSIVNYEIGYKSRFFHDRVSVNVDGFYIDWSNIQLTGTSGLFSYRANGKSASSRGIEASASAVPVAGLTVGATGAYTDAHLDDAAPLLGAAAGDRLPFSPRWTASLLADYRFSVGLEDVTAFAGGTLRYVGARNSSYNGSASDPQYRLPAYELLDLRAGLESDNWRLTAFIANVTDNRAQLSSNTSFYNAINAASVVLARPRTFGVTLSATF